MRRIQLDIRQFAFPCPMVGNIETHSGYGMPPMNGQEIHQMVQRRRVRDMEGYTPEKSLSYTFTREPYEFVISGRADGFVEKPAFIEEIKSCFDIDDLQFKLSTNSDHPYLWQLRTYGYFHYKITEEIPRLSMTLVSSRNYRDSSFEVELNVEDYERWLERRLEKLVTETKAKEKVFSKRKKMAEKMIHLKTFFLLPRTPWFFK